MQSLAREVALRKRREREKEIVELAKRLKNEWFAFLSEELTCFSFFDRNRRFHDNIMIDPAKRHDNVT